MGAALQAPNRTGDALAGRTIEECLSACGFGAHARVEPLLSALSGVPATYEAWFGSKWFEISSQPLLGQDGNVESVLVLALDATKRKLAQIDLQRRDAALRLATFEAPMLLQTRDENLLLTFLTGAHVRDLQFDPGAAMGTRFEVVPGTADEDHSIIIAHRLALQGRQSDAVQFELRNRLIEARVEPLREEDGTISGTVSVWFDVTEQRRTNLLANHDVLTGLPNRTLLRELLTQGLAVSREHRSAAAVVALDIDDFKRINDTLGIDAGDRLLASVAQRIREALRPSDSAARSSGDEFMIVRPDLDDVNATQLTQALLDAFKQPFQIYHQELFVNASIGVSVYPSDGEDAEQLLTRADAALVAAKARTRGGVQFFRSSLHAAAIERLSLEGELRRALGREEFVLHYQPIIDVRTKKLVGAEALIRWQHPQRGLILPGQFIPACEQNGLIVPIGSWVLRTACAQWASWFPRGGPQFVSVNVSPRQLEHDIVDDVRSVLEQMEIPPESVELEVTENALIKDQEPGIEVACSCATSRPPHTTQPLRGQSSLSRKASTFALLPKAWKPSNNMTCLRRSIAN